MANYISIDRSVHIPRIRRTRLVLSVVLVLAVALISVLSISVTPMPQQQNATSHVEDWHGNVRRSHWPE